jgi:hypothetical protein
MNPGLFEMRSLLDAAGFRVRSATRTDFVHCDISDNAKRAWARKKLEAARFDAARDTDICPYCSGRIEGPIDGESQEPAPDAMTCISCGGSSPAVGVK